MKKERSGGVSRAALFVVLALGAKICLGQTLPPEFEFDNYGVLGHPGSFIFGPDTNNPALQQWGNTPDNWQAGTQIYSGPVLSGSGYSVEAFYVTNPAANVFQLLSDAKPVTASLLGVTAPAGTGYFNGGLLAISDAVPVPQPTNYSAYVYLQVRAWDNAGGQLSTWDQAWAAAQAGDGKSVGWSTVFWQPLVYGDLSQPKPPMTYFESFNTFIAAEPKAIWLLALSGAALWACVTRARRGPSP